MTLEEGIEFFEEIAREEYEMVDTYHTDEGVYGREEAYHREKAEHHEQVAEWLKELKALKDRPTKEVIEDIRSELHENAEMHMDGEWYLRDKWINEIIDKHMAKIQ